MPMPKRLTATGSSGFSRAWIPDYGCNPFIVSVGGIPTSSGVIYSVQHTFDPLMSNTQIPGVSVVSASAATWYNHATITAASCNLTATYITPVLGIRALISSNSSATGAVTVTIVQTGP